MVGVEFGLPRKPDKISRFSVKDEAKIDLYKLGADVNTFLHLFVTGELVAQSATTICTTYS